MNTTTNNDVLLRLDHVVKWFPIRSSALLRGGREHVHAVDGVSLEIRRGETVGLVGETGCGKSTLARCASRLYDINSGTVTFDGRDISRLGRRELRPIRRNVQMIFQDPYGSLNPRRRVGSIIADPLHIHGIGRRGGRKKLVQETMELVGLNPEHYNRYPHEFSGGQRQRIGIARALGLEPDLIIGDEPVSALDVSIQAQIINLLKDLQEELGLTYVFIAHDLSVVRYVSDRVAVMYLGKIAVEFDGQDISSLEGSALRDVRREVQMIFQDPYGSLNPRRRVGSIIADPLHIHGIGHRGDRKRLVQETMELVGLNPENYNRYPAEFSGGQRQRIGVARALILKPDLIICDEPVSALDVSIQAQILNLLSDLQEELNLTYLFIAHDLSVVRHISDRVAVMYLGKIVEIGETEQLFTGPRHPYTAALLAAAEEPDPDLVRNKARVILPGDPPSPIALPSGCPFHPRCPKAVPECARELPQLEPRLSDPESHQAACLFPVHDGEDLALATPAPAQRLPREVAP